MLPRSSTARHRGTAAQSPTGSTGSSTVHPDLRSADPTPTPHRTGSTLGNGKLDSDGASSARSRGQQLWGKARGTMGFVDTSLNPNENTFRPNGVETEDEAREAIIRKRDPLRGKKAKLASYCVLLVVFLATSLGARPTLDIYSQNSFLENMLMLRVDEESGMKQQELGIAWSFITTEVRTPPAAIFYHPYRRATRLRCDLVLPVLAGGLLVVYDSRNPGGAA
eukprot:COSAG02_NODE_5461_length_4300_cov_29.607712_6_plen_223_part_00